MMTRHQCDLLGMVLAMLLGMGLGASAEEGGHGMASHGEGTAEHFHRNHFGVFLGSTQAEEHHGERDDPSFTIGLDYERRFSRLFGAGLLVDWVVEGHRELLVGVPFFLHVGEHAVFHVAPGWQQEREDYDAWFVTRIGAMWNFEVGRGVVAPVVIYDVTEEYNLWVLGVNIGKGW